MLERWRRPRAAQPAEEDLEALEGSGLFDAAFYRAACNPDVGGADPHTLAHFRHSGWRATNTF